MPRLSLLDLTAPTFDYGKTRVSKDELLPVGTEVQFTGDVQNRFTGVIQEVDPTDRDKPYKVRCHQTGMTCWYAIWRIKRYL